RPLDVQLVASDRSGPRPLSQLRVGGPANLGRPGSDRGRERVAELRDNTGVLPLRDNRLLEEVALEHATYLCAGEALAHTRSGENPEDRLRGAGVRARVVGEVVARATSEGAAFDALEESPSHRAALVDRRLTDVGIGLARADDGELCAVVLLAAWPRRF
ncbi:MAG: CAP domain-containing protein, partial [Myxococcota bacterium]